MQSTTRNNKYVLIDPCAIAQHRYMTIKKQIKTANRLHGMQIVQIQKIWIILRMLVYLHDATCGTMIENINFLFVQLRYFWIIKSDTSITLLYGLLSFQIAFSSELGVMSSKITRLLEIS